MMYTPKPIDTSGVALPQSLSALIEVLAENVHENWAHQRILEGWQYGETRDDLKKQTPCLVPYSALPEHERVYDRQTAAETIKAVISMGYQIRK